MLHRLCGSPSIPLSFSLAAVVLRRYTYHVSLDPETVELFQDLVYNVYSVDYRGI